MLKREFVEAVVEAVKALLPEMNVESREIIKNNDVVLNGILIKKGNEEIVPTIYIENYIKDGYTTSDYINNINRIASEIVDTYKNYNTEVDVSNVKELVKDFSKAAPLLRIKLVNKENNKKTFETVPYLPFLDMAIIVVIELQHNKQGCATIKVTHDMLQHWNYVAISDILPIARENTFRTPYVLQSMAEIMAELMGLSKEIFEAEMQFPMNVLTNKTKLNGATEICNYSTMKEIAEQFQSDLIVLPSSIHEVIIVPKIDDMNIEDLTNMVKEVNESEVAEDEVLSDHAYVFTRENGWDF